MIQPNEISEDPHYIGQLLEHKVWLESEPDAKLHELAFKFNVDADRASREALIERLYPLITLDQTFRDTIHCLWTDVLAWREKYGEGAWNFGWFVEANYKCRSIVVIPLIRENDEERAEILFTHALEFQGCYSPLRDISLDLN